MKIEKIRQFMAYSKEGPTFSADLRGLVFADGICGPISAELAQRATLFGAQVIEVEPGGGVEWEQNEIGWTLRPTPARDDVDLGRLIVLDPDDLPRELSHDLLAILKGYDLRSGKRK